MARQLVVATLWIEEEDCVPGWEPVDEVRVALKGLKARGTTGQVAAYPQHHDHIGDVMRLLRRLDVQEAVLA